MVRRTKRRALLAAAALAALGAVVVATPVLDVGAIGGNDRPGPAAPVGGPNDVPGPAPATLSDEQRAEAARLALADPRVRRVTAGRGASVARAVPWATMDERTFGAVVAIVLERPASIDARLPATDYDETERSTPPYRVEHVHVVAEDVDELLVRVDLERRAVVSIQPGERARVLVPAPATAPPEGATP